MKTDYKLGLVLSGGGAKGAAHIGAIKAMEERGIKPDVVAGTSAGAIVGALYCAGYSSEEILEVFLKTSVFQPTNLAWKKAGLLDIKVLEKVLTPMFSDNSFEGLNIPFYLVATNITKASEKIFSSGELIRPLLASSCFPVVFAPVEINDDLYLDGGILNNFPVEVIREQCNQLIGINVQHVGTVEKSKLTSTFSVFQRIYTISSRFSSTSKYKDCDLIIAPDSLLDYNTFAMNKMEEMYQLGYDEACVKLDEIDLV